MKQNVYVGLLDTCESRSEAEAESTQAYADSAITNRYDGIANRLITSLDIRECTDGAEGFRINKALWILEHQVPASLNEWQESLACVQLIRV